MATLTLGKKLITPNIRVFIPPLLFLGILIIISILAARVGFARIGSQREELAGARRNENILSQKESVLRELQTDVPGYAQTAATVLPEKNPALILISQLKTLSAPQGLILGNFKVGSEIGGEGAIATVDVTFAVDGSFAQVVEFIGAIARIAPLSNLEKAKINQSLGAARADVTVRAFFSPFPQQLPALTEPQRNLTDEEKDTLSRLASLTLPPFIELAPLPGVIRENPFE